MPLVLLSLFAGMLIGQNISPKLLELNDKLFSVISTLFIFIMGISLGTNRAILTNSGEFMLRTILITVMSSLGSIVFSLILVKLRGKNV